MKRLFCVAIIGLLATASAAHAQQMLIGVRGGMNDANQEWDGYNAGSSSDHIGFLGGGQFDYCFDKSWALSIQAIYDQKGAEGQLLSLADGPPPRPDGTSEWTTSYLEIPLLVKVCFHIRKKPYESGIQPYIFAGPSIGFLLSNFERLQSSGYYYVPNPPGFSPATDTTVNISDSTKKIDFSIVGGAGVSMKLQSGLELFLDAGYAYGLTNIDGYASDKANGFSVYSRDIRLAAGILFPIR